MLSTLSEKPDRRMDLKSLAQKMEWSRSRLSHHASRMQDRGLVDREPDPADARGCILWLTDSGHAVLEMAAPRHVRSVRRRLVDHLTPAELALLGEICERIAGLPDE